MLAMLKPITPLKQANWLLLALCFILGLAHGVFGLTVGLILLGVGVAALAFLLFQFIEVKPNLIWLVLVGSYLGFPFLSRLIGPSILGNWQFLVILASLLGITTFFRALPGQRWMIASISCFAIFLIFALASTLFGRSHLNAAAYQLFSDFKPFFLIIFGFAIKWDKPSENVLWFLVKWYWLPALLCIAWEWASPGTYFTIFPKPGEASPDPTGVFPSRAIGTFEHPGMLADCASDLAMLALIAVFSSGFSKIRYTLLIAVYLLIIVCSVQRQELLNTVICLGFVIMFIRPDKVKQNVAIVLTGSLILLTVFWLLFADNLMKEAAMWGIGEGNVVEIPRAQIFAGGIKVAQQYFPIGAGLGTYGGAGAKNYDLSLHEDLGFDSYWWFRTEDYLMDTYWPNPIAEVGFLGSLFLLFCYLCLFAHALSRGLKAKGQARPYWLATASGVLYMLMLSFSSPAFQDPRLFFMPAILFGLAHYKESQDKAISLSATANDNAMSLDHVLGVMRLRRDSHSD